MIELTDQRQFMFVVDNHRGAVANTLCTRVNYKSEPEFLSVYW